MQEYQQRVVEEKRELDEKLEKLDSYLAEDTFLELDEPNRDLLLDQREYMDQYSRILAHRIMLFSQP